MPTVYIQPGSGTGTGTLADPYYYSSQLSSAETAAGSGGTILFIDGDYNFSSNVSFSADGVTYKAVNRLGAKILASTNSHTFTIGSTSITAPTIADGFYVENLLLVLSSPAQPATSSQTAKFINSKLTQVQRHTLVNGISSTAGSFKEVNGCELNFKPGQSGIRPFANCSGGTMSNCSVYLDFGTSYTVSDRSSAKFDSFTDCIIASNDGSSFTENYTTNATNCIFHEMGTTNSSGGTDNIFQDPLYVDPGSDLRLRPASPAIGAAS
jgi:hypothetical protein